MRRVIVFIIAASLAVTAGWWLSGLTGQVAGNIAGIQFTTSTPVFITALVVIVLAVHYLLRLLGGIFRSHLRLGSWRSDRRRDAGDVAVSRTLVALAAGEAGEAKRESERARRLLGDTPQTLLLAAEARRLANEDTIAETIYGAMSDRPDAAFLGLRGLFRQAIAKEDWAGAAEIARRADAAHPGGTWLRSERAQLAVRSGNWTQALALTGPEGPVADFAAAAAGLESDPVEATRLARRAWKANPGFTPAALAYARLLRRSGKESRAQEVIGVAWKAFPQPDLAVFALEPVKDKLARVKDAGRLAERNPDHFESHFLLARENLAAGLTKVARRHAEAARRAGLAQKRLWLLIADLEAEERGDTEDGREAQRDALRQAASAEPDPTWRCETCGTVQPGWLPACPACHTAGRIRWGGAARLALSRPK
jgi:HemY protein